jgi:hypothetical protein
MSVQRENEKSPKKQKPSQQQPEARPKLVENGHSKYSKKEEKVKIVTKPAQTPPKSKKDEKKKAEKRPAESSPKSKSEKKKEKKSKLPIIENGSADKDVEEEIEKMSTTEVHDELVPNIVVSEKSKKKKNKKSKEEKIPTLVKIPTPIINNENDGSIVDGKTCFEWMINPMKADSFFTDTFEKRPVHIKRGKPAYYKHLLSTKVFDNMLRVQIVVFGKNLDVTSFTDGKRETHTPEGRAYGPGTFIVKLG